MNKALVLLLIGLAFFAVGCSSSNDYSYSAPPGPAPTGGGCGVGAADLNDNIEYPDAVAAPL